MRSTSQHRRDGAASWHLSGRLDFVVLGGSWLVIKVLVAVRKKRGGKEISWAADGKWCIFLAVSLVSDGRQQQHLHCLSGAASLSRRAPPTLLLLVVTLVLGTSYLRK